MKNEKLLIFALTILLLIGIMPFVSAYYVYDHVGFTLTGFDKVNSPLTQECRPYLDVVLTGNSGSDVFVLYYTSNKVSSYIYSHTAGGYQTCLSEAGSNLETKCFCVGERLHQIQDSFSHNNGGITEKTLKKFLGTNYFGHMIVEQDFQTKHMSLIKKQNPQLYDEIIAKDRIFLNSLFSELGGNDDLMNLLVQISGLNKDDVVNTAKIFRSSYIGEGFYNTVYKDRVSLPGWAVSIPIVLILLGLGIIGLMLKFGKTKWKWFTILLALILIIFGSLIVYSFITGTTWKIVNVGTSIPAKFGYLSVSYADVDYYSRITQEATNKFLEDGEYTLDDASGLSYIDRYGNKVIGSLSKAETGSKFLIGLLLIISLGLIIVIFFKSLVDKKTRKGRLKKLNSILNWSALIMILSIFVLILYFALRILFGI